MKINNNDGFKYKSNEEIVSYYETNNKTWDDTHDILVVKQDIEKVLEKDGEKLIWLFRIDKTLNSLGREKYKDVYDKNSILGICWRENGEFNINFVKG